MYDKEDLKMKLQQYSEMGHSNIMGFISILKKSLKERLEDNDIHKIPPLVDENLQDIVSKNAAVSVVGIKEPTKIEYDIKKMCDDYDEYFNKLVSVIKFANDRHNTIADEIKEERKPRTFSRVSRIISRTTESDVLYNVWYEEAYHKWGWFEKRTEEINKILNDKTLSKYEFDIEFISTDTMFMEHDGQFKVVTVMYFKLTEYIPDEE